MSMNPTSDADRRANGWVMPARPAEPAAALPLAKPTDNVPLGIFWMIGATMLLAIAAAVAKWQTQFYPVGEVMFIRSFAGLVVCAAIILPLSGFAVFATKRPGAHVARGVSQAISQTLTVVAVSLMPLAGAVAISFSAPLWAALLSIIWLKERAGPVRWMVLLTGFSGVIIVTNPGADAFQIGALFALGNAIMYGSVTVAVRGMTATETPNTLLMWQMVTMTLCHSLLLLFGFKWPTAADAAMMAFGGIANAAAQYTWTKALLLAPTSAVSPFYYLMLVWAMVIGFVVWGDMPTTALIIGSAIVIASGLFLLWHEAQKR
jgi:drug/metabolite transporter (DMT)-like permease